MTLKRYARQLNNIFKVLDQMDGLRKMKKLLTVVGARPQFIKAGILSKKIDGEFEEVLLHTGQHYDANMSEVFFNELGIKEPKYNLNVGSSSHAKQTAQMMVGIEEVIEQEKPDGVLTYGDTNSTVAASLTASKMLIPVFHVEGGIRTHCLDMPEEQNRIIADHLSSMIFVSTIDNLREAEREGLGDRSYLVGDIMFDSLIYYSKTVEEQRHLYCTNKLKGILEQRTNPIDNYYLATIHRPENTDREDTFLEILRALNEMEELVVMATHPRIRQRVIQVGRYYPNIYFVEPLSYLETIFFTKNANMIITDSGGLHKEAYLLGIPCVTILRSGWLETKKGGWNKFVAPIAEDILDASTRRNIDRTVMRDDFGNGDACGKIVELLKDYYDNLSRHLY